MTPTWQKLGQIYQPDGSGYFKTHAARPIPYRLDRDTIRLFFSSRDSDDRMLPTYIDVDSQDPLRVRSVGQAPLIGLGKEGTFDDSGVTLGSLVDLGSEVRFYYTGWKRRRVVSFELSIGVLLWDKSSDRLIRLYEGPLIGQDRQHPYLAAGPFVLVESGRYRMWYCSGTGWRFPDGNPEPLYTVFYAESADGLTWEPAPHPVIPYQYDGEVISAPWISVEGCDFHMYYSTRGYSTRANKAYSIGYAHSDDGKDWTRLDQKAGIERSLSGWDSEMVCYPSLLSTEAATYMFYSGNGVGRGGVGVAVKTGASPS